VAYLVSTIGILGQLPEKCYRVFRLMVVVQNSRKNVKTLRQNSFREYAFFHIFDFSFPILAQPMRTQYDCTSRTRESQQLIKPNVELCRRYFSDGPFVERVGVQRSFDPDKIELALTERMQTQKMVHLVTGTPFLEAVVCKEEWIPFYKFNLAGSPFVTYVHGIPESRTNIEEIDGIQVQRELLCDSCKFKSFNCRSLLVFQKIHGFYLFNIPIKFLHGIYAIKYASVANTGNLVFQTFR
jgi:hypothetical protein